MTTLVGVRRFATFTLFLPLYGSVLGIDGERFTRTWLAAARGLLAGLVVLFAALVIVSSIAAVIAVRRLGNPRIGHNDASVAAKNP